MSDCISYPRHTGRGVGGQQWRRRAGLTTTSKGQWSGLVVQLLGEDAEQRGGERGQGGQQAEGQRHQVEGDDGLGLGIGLG